MTRRARIRAGLASAVLIPGGMTLAACNGFTGASSLEIGESATDPEGLVLADGITITRIDLYQGLRRPLMENGVAVLSAMPIVRERDALLRIHYEAEGLVPGITARVTIGDGEPIEIEATAGATSTDEALASTINVPLPGEALQGLTYRVELLRKAEVSSGDNHAASFPVPEATPAPFPLQASGPLRLVVVPVQYDADGSGRLPDLSDAQLELLHDGFFSVFPVPEVDIRITDPMPSNTSVIGTSVAGWSTLLDEVQSFRAQSGAAADEYYLGLFMAAETFGQFCGGGCITGLSNVAFSPGDAFARASIAVGFPGKDSVDTAVHEVGHAHGREHAPCGGAGSPDPNFPRPDGTIGEWGYDLTSGTLIDPTTPDFMGYCDPTWVSDYTWDALFTRGQAVNVAAKQVGAPVTYDRILVLPDGTARWRDPLTLRHPLGGELETVTLDDEREVTGHFYRFDHAAGGILLLPASDARRAELTLAGRPVTVSR